MSCFATNTDFSPWQTESWMDVATPVAVRDGPFATVADAAAEVEELLRRLRANPAEVGRTQKIEIAWQLLELQQRQQHEKEANGLAAGMGLPSMVPLLLEWLQPTLARSERYHMGATTGSASSTSKNRSHKHKQNKPRQGVEGGGAPPDVQEEEEEEEGGKERGPPPFLDERHWGLFHELLLAQGTPTIRTILPLRTEMLRVLSSALLCCVGVGVGVGVDGGLPPAPVVPPEARLAIVARLEPVLRLLLSTPPGLFAPTIDAYVFFLSQVSRALVHLYVFVPDAERPGACEAIVNRLLLILLLMCSYLGGKQDSIEAICVSIASMALKKFHDIKQTVEVNHKKVIPQNRRSHRMWMSSFTNSPASPRDLIQIFTVVVGKLLEPLLTLRSLVQKRNHDEAIADARSQIKHHIEEIVVHALFHPDHLSEYSLAFSFKHHSLTSKSGITSSLSFSQPVRSTLF